jgi:hypothetical protein
MTLEKIPYDEGYKDLLSDKDDFLHFLKKYIAKPWTADISSEGIQKIDKSFITNEYKHIDSDLIYKLKIKGSDVYFYVLLELQSNVDFTMPFRLLRYVVALLDDIFQNTDKNERERKDFKLPAIVPVILYSGKDNWTAAPAYRDYTERGDMFGGNIIDFSYILFDLQRTDEETMSPINKLFDVVFALEKNCADEYADADAIAERLGRIQVELTEDDKSSLFKWVKYVCLKGDVSPDFEMKFKESISKKEEGGIMKFAIQEMLERRDKDVMTKAELKAKLDVARNLLAKGMPVNDVTETTGLTIDDVLRLQQ